MWLECYPGRYPTHAPFTTSVVADKQYGGPDDLLRYTEVGDLVTASIALDVDVANFEEQLVDYVVLRRLAPSLKDARQRLRDEAAANRATMRTLVADAGVGIPFADQLARYRYVFRATTITFAPAP